MANKENLGALEWITAAVGVSPIPVVGELALARFFYKITEDALEDNKAAHLGASLAGSILTKYAMITQMPFYKAMYVGVLEKVLG